MESKARAVIVMKVGPHSNMSLEEIIKSKREEELIHGVHYWGYSGVFCRPLQTQEFCKWAKKTYGENPMLILLETKSTYESTIGFIKHYSSDNHEFVPFTAPVQLQGAQFSFVAKNLHPIESFNLDDYIVHGGKNDGKRLSAHLRFRINKSFALLENDFCSQTETTKAEPLKNVLAATLTEPYAIWLKE